ncbi:SPOR domain-containing protein [Pseudoxanthomonas gei]|uniref:SPOR domain-containing protein n=1 Tax=Pseudoxanthomonas gei TaxID=1383030 RepID=A0ABX0AGQ0_9GAMM|nr:SPOR domain-containing protein [Pseudoxanthomonas gei]NDK38424.1 SPOR domain-containing protein [Pseudoxanthomonas gei]
MLIRAVIVLLLVLNLGVAAWWLSRPPATGSRPVPAHPAGVPRLQLLEEKGSAAAPATLAPPAASAGIVAADVPAAVAAPVTAGPAQCFAIGPFADADATRLAASRLVDQSVRRRPRETPGKGASGYNVVLPPSADRDTAQALARRIGAAGFDDYLVINSGEQANGIALGRYRSREAAERRQASLGAAGFAAQLQPIGQEGAMQWWLEVEARADASGPQLKALAAAAQLRSLDCATLR